MYASQQGVWQNSLGTGIFDTLPEIVGGWWGIGSTAEARGQLDYLCVKGIRYYWLTVLEAFRLDGRERQDELHPAADDLPGGLRQGLAATRKPARDLRRAHIVRRGRLKRRTQRLQRDGLSAGRIVFLARACCEMGYLTERRHGRTSDVPTRWRTKRAGRSENWP